MGKFAKGLALLLVGAVLVLLALWQWWRPGLEEYQAHLVPAAEPADGLEARWYGVSAVLLRERRAGQADGGVFIDPFFTRPGGALRLLGNPPVQPDEALIRRWLADAGVSRLDAVLVSHSHYDHAMDAGVVARLTGAVLVGSASTLNIGRGAGLPETQLASIASLEARRFGEFSLRFLPSRHAGATGGRPLGDIESALQMPARLADYRQGGTYSILIRHPQLSVLHHGSAGFEPDALRGERADVAFLGVALIDDLDAYLAQTVHMVGAKSVIPVHWDDFTRPLAQSLQPMPLVVNLPRFFRGMAGQPGVRVYSMALGQAVNLTQLGD